MFRSGAIKPDQVVEKELTFFSKIHDLDKGKYVLTLYAMIGGKYKKMFAINLWRKEAITSKPLIGFSLDGDEELILYDNDKVADGYREWGKNNSV